MHESVLGTPALLDGPLTGDKSVAAAAESGLDIEHGLCIIDSVQFPQLSSAAQTNNTMVRLWRV